MVLAVELLEVHASGALVLAQQLHRGRSGRRRDGLAVQVGDALDAGALLGRDAHFLDVHRRREGDVLLARRVVGGRAALEVDGAVLDQRDAVLRRHRLVLHFELGQAELLLDVGDDVRADVVVKAGVLAVAERERERARRLADAFGDDPGVLDLLQRVLGVRSAGDAERRGDERDTAQKRFLHGYS